MVVLSHWRQHQAEPRGQRGATGLPGSGGLGAFPAPFPPVLHRGARRRRSFSQCRAEGGRGLPPAAGCESPLASVASLSVALRDSRTCGAKGGTGVTHQSGPSPHEVPQRSRGAHAVPAVSRGAG